MKLSQITNSIANFFKNFYAKHLSRFIAPIYVKHFQKHVDYFYLNHLKYNKYFEELVFLLRATPKTIQQIYQKWATLYCAKTTQKQRKWIALLIIAWVIIKIAFAGYDFWQEVTAPKTELGPNNSLIITPQQVKSRPSNGARFFSG